MYLWIIPPLSHHQIWLNIELYLPNHHIKTLSDLLIHFNIWFTNWIFCSSHEEPITMSFFSFFYQFITTTIHSFHISFPLSFHLFFHFLCNIFFYFIFLFSSSSSFYYIINYNKTTHEILCMSFFLSHKANSTL